MILAPLAYWTIIEGRGSDLAILLAIFGPIGYFTVRRHRWAFVLSSLLVFNPLWWIINGVYFYNRWREMPAPKNPKNLNSNTDFMQPEQPTGRASSITPPTIKPSTVESRLKEAGELHRKGLLSDAEFEESRRRILSDL